MHADNGSTVQIVSAATVISVFVLVGIILLILGLLVYIIKIKRKKNRRYLSIIILYDIIII